MIDPLTDFYEEHECSPALPRKPKLSICIPTYDRASHLVKAIESVLVQSHQDYELIIVDNASTDSTQTVVQSFDSPFIRNCRFATLVSAYANHNRCVRLARSPWVVFIHSDDTFPRHFLACVESAIESNPAADLLSPPLFDSIQRGLLKLGENSALDAMMYSIAMGGHSPSGAIYRRSSFKQYGFFREESIYADTIILCEWVRKGGRFALFNPPAPVYSISDVSLTNTIDRNHSRREFCLIVEEVMRLTQIGELKKNIQSFCKSHPHEGILILQRMFDAGFKDVALELLQAAKEIDTIRNSKLYRRQVPMTRASKILSWPAYRFTRTTASLRKRIKPYC